MLAMGSARRFSADRMCLPGVLPDLKNLRSSQERCECRHENDQAEVDARLSGLCCAQLR